MTCQTSRSIVGSIYDYECGEVISEGTFGVVYSAYKGGRKFAIKKLKMTEQDKDAGIYKREIETLKLLDHENVVRLYECVTNDRDHLFLVFDYHDYDLKRLILETPRLSESFVKNLMIQLFNGLKYIHHLQICHRDLKMANLLINLTDGRLRIADFGSNKKVSSEMTPDQVTLWFRAPEILLGSRHYGTEVDIWSAGCVFAELLTGKPLFDGHSEIEQIDKIFNLLGAPTGLNWPSFDLLPLSRTLKVPNTTSRMKIAFKGISENALDLLQKLVQYEPRFRLSAKEALSHPYFKEDPLPDAVGSIPNLESVAASPVKSFFLNR
jgi:serine/threonine protein kinase